MAKQKIYFRNSAVRLRFTDAEGNAIPLAEMDWDAALYTPTADTHLVVSHSVDGGFAGCTPLPGSDTDILVDLSAGTVLPGALKARFRTPDGETVKIDLGVDLTALPTHAVSAAQVTATLPVVMGKVREVFDRQIEEVFSPVLDEIAAQVEAILGGTAVLPPSAGGGGTAAAAPSVPLFREGIIPWDAEPKYVYRNLGKVKVGKLAKKLDRKPTTDELAERIDGGIMKVDNNQYELTASKALINCDAPYLRRNPDTGMIEGYSGPVAMPPQPSDAPQVYKILSDEAEVGCMSEAVEALLGEGKWERRGVYVLNGAVCGHRHWQVQAKIQYKSKVAGKSHRWVTFTSRESRKRGDNRHRCGIFRIRAVSHRRKYKGRWQVYTYCPRCIRSI